MFVPHRGPVSGVFKGIMRPAVQRLREIPVVSSRLWQRGRGPVAVFLPAYGPEGAVLLRIYRVAGALRGLGWRTLVLPWRLTLAQRQRLLDRKRGVGAPPRATGRASARPGLGADPARDLSP